MWFENYVLEFFYLSANHRLKASRHTGANSRHLFSAALASVQDETQWVHIAVAHKDNIG